jgi:heterotetrameric sarcosine oxidase delta subunit
MLRITCPWCGPRDEIEFRCGGQSHIVRPGPPDEVDDTTWGRYLSEKINPRGVHFERWVHSSGCQQWFNVARDTATHHISAVYPMIESAPTVDAGGVTL